MNAAVRAAATIVATFIRLVRCCGAWRAVTEKRWIDGG